MAQQLTLTGLGNEMNLSSGKMVFTAVFNNKIRIEISKDAAEILTTAIYSSPDYAAPPIAEDAQEEEEEQPRTNGHSVAGTPVLEDAEDSLYDSDTGVEQV